MQVGSSSPFIPSLPVDSRRGAADGQSRPVTVEAEPERAPREVFRLRSRDPAPAQGVGHWQSLSPHSRNALQSYLSNAPSPVERYGVELAGIDLFV